jgi:hypothetical protein
LTVVVPIDTMQGVKESKTLGGRLREARMDKRLGVNELTRLVELPDGGELAGGYVSRVESGERKAIPAIYAHALAHALGVRPEWLLSGIGPKRFASGEMLAVAAPAKPNLERVLAKMNLKGRWNPPTVAAARATDVDVAPSEWPDVLDGMQTGLEPLLKRLNR